jgi:hypothetical protein
MMQTYNDRFSTLTPAFYVLCLLSVGLIIQGCNGNATIRVPAIEVQQEPDLKQERDSDLEPEPDSEIVKPEVMPPVQRHNSGSTTQHALVVGINQYQYADGLHLKNLGGAVNDAELLTEVLRRTQVQLPAERVLLDAQATRTNVIRAWRNMVKQANPGDTLIFTFSGHGGQQSDTVPLDEKDNKDETLMFHDFNPYKPNQGRITDDELYGIFEEARDYKILFLADACHSSGMVRATLRTSGRFRTGGFWEIQQEEPPPSPVLPTQSDEDRSLAHVTLITAVDSDILKVPETTLNNKWYGALSWFFAQALSGEADGNKNGRLERNELSSFLREKVRKKMNHLQTPKLLPRADKQSVIRLSYKSVFEPPPVHLNISDIAIVAENGRVPSGLKHIQVANTSLAHSLRFVIKNGQIDVLNNTGDKISTLHSTALHLWQRVIDKARLLNALDTQFDMRRQPIHITLREGDKLHKKGEVLHFSVAPGDTKEGLNALTLFNLAGNGELQFLYPLIEYKDPTVVKHFPHNLPPTKVAPPFGGDNLVAVLCEKPATGLHTLLAENQPAIPKHEQILSQLRKDNNRCQVGQYAFFSSE